MTDESGQWRSGDPIRVALAAYGLSGRVFHAPLIAAHSGFRLVKVCERAGSRYATQQYPSVRAVRRFDDILNDPDIELVVINTPEDTHYGLAKEALEAGKHVVVEKAFTVTSGEASALMDLAAARGKVLSVFQNSRWHGDFLTVKSLLHQGLLGRVVACGMRFDRYRPAIEAWAWKEAPGPGRGSLYNLGVHLIDQALVLFGWPRSLFADLRIQRTGGQVVDDFELVLDYGNLKVTLGASYLAREPGPRFSLHGTEGSFVKYGTDPQEAMLRQGRSPGEKGWGAEPEEAWGILHVGPEDPVARRKLETVSGSYLVFYENIGAVIREDADLIVKPGEARDAVRIIEAAMQSHAQKRVVELEKP